ncbi:hypothetical protein KCU89_g8693, partial [Aureobasidium melanogenum]
MTHKYESTRGSMLAHLPGVNGDVRQELMNDWMDHLDKGWSMQCEGNNNSTNPTTADFGQSERMTKTWDRGVKANETSLWTLPGHETSLLNETTAFWSRYREAMALSLEATSSGAHDRSGRSYG